MECYCTNHCACQPEALMQCRQEVRFKTSRSSLVHGQVLNLRLSKHKPKKYQQKEHADTKYEMLFSFQQNIIYLEQGFFDAWKIIVCLHRKILQFFIQLSNALRSSCQQDQRIEINPKSIGLNLMIMFLVLIFVTAIILFYIIKRKLPICYRKKKFKTYVYKSKVRILKIHMKFTGIISVRVTRTYHGSKNHEPKDLNYESRTGTLP